MGVLFCKGPIRIITGYYIGYIKILKFNNKLNRYLNIGLWKRVQFDFLFLWYYYFYSNFFIESFETSYILTFSRRVGSSALRIFSKFLKYFTWIIFFGAHRAKSSRVYNSKRRIPLKKYTPFGMVGRRLIKRIKLW